MTWLIIKRRLYCNCSNNKLYLSNEHYANMHVLDVYLVNCIIKLKTDSEIIGIT